jgi:hypothetical protein
MHERPNFMREDPPSWTRGWYRQNDAIWGGKVQNVNRTHESEGATEPGQDGPGPVDPGRLARPTPVLVRPRISCASRWCNPEYVEAPPFTDGEPFAREVVHKLEREKRREIIRKEDRSTRRKQPQVEEDIEALQDTPGGEGRHCRKRHHDKRCYT